MEENKEIVVNTEKIMREIRRKAMEENEKYLPSFDDIRSASGMNRAINNLRNNNQLSYQWSFGPRNLKTFIKRVIRKVIKCVLLPIITQQNEINMHVTNCVSEMQKLSVENMMLKKEISALKGKMQEQDALLQEIQEALKQ